MPLLGPGVIKHTQTQTLTKRSVLTIHTVIANVYLADITSQQYFAEVRLHQRPFHSDYICFIQIQTVPLPCE